jgi:hypothetical protein
VIVLQADEGFQADEATFGEKAMQQIRVKGLIAPSTSRVPASLPGPSRPTR